MKKTSKVVFAIALAMMMALTSFSGVVALPEISNEASQRANSSNSRSVGHIMTTESIGYEDEDIVSVIVELDGAPILSIQNESMVKSVEANLEKEQLEAQMKIEKILGEEIKINYHYTVVMNGFSFNTTYANFKKIKQNSNINAKLGNLYNLPSSATDGENQVEMANSTTMVGADIAWNTLGYTGRGTAVAVLDTGLYVNHEAFSVAPPSQKISKTDVQNKLSSLKARVNGSTAPTISVYRSGKVPYAFDYAYYRLDVSHLNNVGEHGSHVAGIVAGNNGKDFKGIAPDAQLVICKVFHQYGAPSEAILAGLEDAIILGVDSVNLSLGSTSGFSSGDSFAEEDVYNRLRQAGIVVACAEGNAYSSTYGTEWGNNLGLAENVDIGTPDSPATYPVNLTVASINNTICYRVNFHVGDKLYIYEDSSADYTPSMDFNAKLGGKSYTYVPIDGAGLAEDYQGKDVRGRIALVQRGGCTFEEKMTNAYNAGAAAIIVYNNQPGEVRMQISRFTIPGITITQAAGLELLEVENKTIVVPKTAEWIDNKEPGLPSDFSAWGVTPDLKLKPEIAAPGGMIYSAGDNNKYLLMDGTSMATPHIAGAAAIISQYVSKNYSNYKNGAKTDFINALMLSTATPVRYDNSSTPYSPRKQGSGMLNLSGALTTKAYLQVDSEYRPVVNLGQDTAKKGEYKVTFKVVNFGSQALTYKIDTRVITEKVVEDYGYKFMAQEAFDLNEYAQITTNMVDDTVKVNANSTETVTVTIKLNDEAKKYMDDNFMAGIFVDGFVFLEAQDNGSIDLSLPFMGFYGDWNAAPIFELGSYYEGNGSVLYSNVLGSKMPGMSSDFYIIGMNPYATDEDDFEFEFKKERMTYSPNSDYKMDNIDLFYTGLMRNAKTITYNITDAATGKSYATDSFSRVRKSIYNFDTLYVVPYGMTRDVLPTSATLRSLPDGSKVKVSITGTLDTRDYSSSKNYRDSVEYVVTADTKAPTVDENSIKFYQRANGEVVMTADFTDNQYIAFAEVQDASTRNGIAHALFAPDKAGEKVTATFELGVIKENTTLRLFMGDYAMNEAIQNVIVRITAKQYTVTFIDGLTDEVLAVEGAFEGESVEAPEAPVHEGYKFVGWSEDYTNIHSDLEVIAMYEEEIPEIVPVRGDANEDGIIDSSDATTVLRYVAKLENLSEQAMANADANLDGMIDSADATTILRVVAQLETF